MIWGCWPSSPAAPNCTFAVTAKVRASWTANGVTHLLGFNEPGAALPTPNPPPHPTPPPPNHFCLPNTLDDAAVRIVSIPFIHPERRWFPAMPSRFSSLHLPFYANVHLILTTSSPYFHEPRQRWSEQPFASKCCEILGSTRCTYVHERGRATTYPLSLYLLVFLFNRHAPMLTSRPAVANHHVFHHVLDWTGLDPKRHLRKASRRHFNSSVRA